MSSETKNLKLECVVEYDYDAQLGDELTIRVGDVITDIETMEGGWWKGSLRGKVGMFPDNFVKPLPTQKDPSFETEKKCHVLFSYSPAHDDELALEVGDIIEYMGDVEEGWYKGRLNGRVGVFPSNFVEISNTNNCDIKSNHHLQGETTDEAKKIYPDLQKVAGNSSAKSAGDKAGESNAPDLTLTNGSLATGAGSERSPTAGMTTSERLLRNTEPAPGAAPRLPPKPVKDQCVVLFPYASQNQDELTLVEGQVITILSRVIEDAGWWRGEIDGKVGVFPDNFVKVVTQEAAEGGQTPPSSSKASTALTRGNRLLADKKPQTEGDKENLPEADNKRLSSSSSAVKRGPSSEKLFSPSADKKVLSSEKLTPTASSEKKVSSSEKLFPASPSSTVSPSTNHVETSRLTRTSSDRGSSGHTPTKMSAGMSAVRSATQDSIKSSSSSSSVSEKKALFGGSSRAEDKIAKKPAMPVIGSKSAISSVISNIAMVSAARADTTDQSLKKDGKELEEERIDVVMRADSTTRLAEVDREKPLTSLTASRVKAPKRRPPSNVFLKDNIPEIEDAAPDNGDSKEVIDVEINEPGKALDVAKSKDNNSSNSTDKQFIPGKIGVPVFPVKDFGKAKEEKSSESNKKAKEDNPIKNIWLEELSRKQANRKSMSALNEKKIDSGKPAIPSKPLDTRKSLSNLIRRPNSFGEKTGLGQGKQDGSDVKSVLSKTVSNSVAADSRHVSKPESIKKLSSERSRKDSVGKESAENLRNASPKKSSEERLYFTGRTRESPRSSNKENKLVGQLGNKESKDAPRSSSKELEKKKPELTRKSSDSSKSSDTKPSVHSTNLGKPGSWAFTSPERPSDLLKSEFSRSKLDLISTKSDSRLDTPTKASSNGGLKSLDTHEEAGFVVVEAANEALASVWAQDGQQPRPPAREKHQSGLGIAADRQHQSVVAGGVSHPDHVKALERRVEELERILSRVETSFKSELAHLNSQLESEKIKRVELESEVSKLSKIVSKKM